MVMFKFCTIDKEHQNILLMQKFLLIAKSTGFDVAILILNIVAIALLHSNDKLSVLLFWVLLVNILVAGFKFLKDAISKLHEIERKEQTDKAIKAAFNQAADSLEFPISLMIYHNPDTFSFLRKSQKTKADYKDDIICRSFFNVNFNHYLQRPMDANIYGHGLAYDVSNLTQIAMNRFKDSFLLYSDSIDPKLKIQYQKLLSNGVIFTMLECNELYNSLLENNIEKFNYSYEQKKGMKMSFFNYDNQRTDYLEIIEFIYACKNY